MSRNYDSDDHPAFASAMSPVDYMDNPPLIFGSDGFLKRSSGRGSSGAGDLTGTDYLALMAYLSD